MPLDWVFLAMTHFRLGNAAEARRWLDRDLEGSSLSWHTRLEVRFLRKEAEELIGR